MCNLGRKINLKWDEWNPGLDTDDLTLADVLETMPQTDEQDVPSVVKKYENPSSPFALPGALNIDRHDCLHVILGRGMHVDDEAFIIGVTMGAASDITDSAIEKFIKVSTTEYPRHWKFTTENINSFRLGVGFSFKNLQKSDIHLIPLELGKWQKMKVSEIRKRLQISKHELRAYFRFSQTINPDMKSSKRLDTSPNIEDGAF